MLGEYKHVNECKKEKLTGKGSSIVRDFLELPSIVSDISFTHFYLEWNAVLTLVQSETVVAMVHDHPLIMIIFR